MGNSHPAIMVRNSNIDNEDTPMQMAFFDQVHIVGNVSNNNNLNPGIHIDKSTIKLNDVTTFPLGSSQDRNIL